MVSTYIRLVVAAMPAVVVGLAVRRILGPSDALPIYRATLVIYMIMVFLLSKLVIEKNTTNISMTKVLGFHPKEINRLFNRNSDFIKFWE